MRTLGTPVAVALIFLAACGHGAEPPPAPGSRSGSPPAPGPVVDATPARPADPDGAPVVALAAKHRGVSWVAVPRVVTSEDFDSLVATGANWIVQTPFGWQARHDTPELRLITEGPVFWGETDEGLEVTTRLARERGLTTLLKPHVWLQRPEPGTWHADISMSNPDEWRAWWDDYRTFILHYARLAERLGAGGFCVGTELLGPVRHDPGEWRRLIADVREVFSGELTYAANWYAEFEEVPFWDALDYIGIQAYFPLADGNRPSVEELKAAWRPHLEAIERVQRRFGKPVLFTEVGYRSAPGAARDPWSWPEHLPHDTPADLEIQERAYRAFFEVFWDRPWFAGAYVWKWYPGNHEDLSENNDFTPQGKPAGKVLAEWYRRTAGADEAPGD